MTKKKQKFSASVQIDEAKKRLYAIKKERLKSRAQGASGEIPRRGDAPSMATIALSRGTKRLRRGRG